MTAQSRKLARKSMSFADQKLNIVEDHFQLGSAGEEEALHQQHHQGTVRKRFGAAVSGQFWAFFRAETLRPSFSGPVTMYILLLCVIIVELLIESSNQHLISAYMYSTTSNLLGDAKVGFLLLKKFVFCVPCISIICHRCCL